MPTSRRIGIPNSFMKAQSCWVLGINIRMSLAISFLFMFVYYCICVMLLTADTPFVV